MPAHHLVGRELARESLARLGVSSWFTCIDTYRHQRAEDHGGSPDNTDQNTNRFIRAPTCNPWSMDCLTRLRPSRAGPAGGLCLERFGFENQSRSCHVRACALGRSADWRSHRGTFDTSINTRQAGNAPPLQRLPGRVYALPAAVAGRPIGNGGNVSPFS